MTAIHRDGAITPAVAAQDLQEFGDLLLRASGMTGSESQAVSTMLVETSLRGTDSHGIMRFPVYARRCMAGGIVSPAPVTRVRDDGGVVLLDGGGGSGHVVGAIAVDEVVRRASSHGIASVGVRNSNHLGALALYARRIADRGQIGIVMTNASPRIAPTGGYEPLLGNNPWAIGIPHDDAPVVMDIAHSVAAVGKIRIAKALGQPIPPGWARDRNGLPTTDPDAALAGLLEPIGGHKGYALVFMIDVLCGVLTGAASGPNVSGLLTLDRPSAVGHQFIAINIGHFGEPDAFAARLSLLIQLIRDSGRAPGVDKIYLPGDPENLSQRTRLAEGIPLSAAVRDDMRQVADELGVTLPAWLQATQPEDRPDV